MKTTIAIPAENMTTNAIKVTVSLPSRELDEAGLPISKDRTLLITSRGGWKVAAEDAAKKDETTNIPRFLIKVEKFPYTTGNYNGTGAIWARSDVYNNGTFQWLDKTYNIELATVVVDDVNTVVFSIEQVVKEDMTTALFPTAVKPAPLAA